MIVAIVSGLTSLHTFQHGDICLPHSSIVQAMAKTSFLSIGVIGSCLLIGVLFGCAHDVNQDEAIAKVNETNIQRLANLYFTYQMNNEWQGPANEGEFKEFIRSYNPDKLARIGIDSSAIDELFISERDGQAFRIRYSVAGSAMGSSEPVIFESVGVGGKRLVGFLNMVQREVDEAEYNDLWAGTSSTSQPREETP